MTVKEFDAKLKRAERDIPAKIFGIVRDYAGVTLRAEISNRVVMSQKKAAGGTFSRYSSKPILSSGETERGKQVWRKLASSKKKRRNLRWVTLKKGGKNIRLFEVAGGYAEIRRIHGFTNANKSFEFTGEMWKKFGVKYAKKSPGGFRIRLAGLTTAAQKKIDANSEREGANIIDISPEEEKELARYIDTWLQKEINRLFFMLDLKFL